MKLPYFDKNESFWIKTVLRDYPPKVLKGKIMADIAIIGAGLLGISSAYHLKQHFPDKHTVVVEAVRVANGASGRNGGAVLALTARESFDSTSWHFRKRRSLDESYLNIWEKTIYGLDLYQQIIDQHGIDCGYTRQGYLSLAASHRDADAMALYAEASSRLGIPVRFLDSTQYRSFVEAEGYHGALYWPDYGQINPARYLCQLAGVVKEMGVDIYEHTPILKIDYGRKCTLFTPMGEIKADTIILATNAYTPRLGYFKDRIVPLINPCAVTRPLDPETLDNIGWHSTRGLDDSSPMVWYMGITEDYRILIGGGDVDYIFGGNPCSLKDQVYKYKAHFKKALIKRFPRAHDVEIEYVWTGPIDATLDLRPSVGIMGEYKNILYGIGFTGEGVNLAHLSGKILTDMYAGNIEPWQDLPFINYTLKRIPPDPFRYIVLKTSFAIGRRFFG